MYSTYVCCRPASLERTGLIALVRENTDSLVLPWVSESGPKPLGERGQHVLWLLWIK